MKSVEYNNIFSARARLSLSCMMIVPDPPGTSADQTIKGTPEEYAKALNYHRDGVLTSMDVIDSAYYLGLRLTPAELASILKELKNYTKLANHPSSAPTSSSPPSCPTTIRVFQLSPSDIMEQIPGNIRLITKNCLPLAQHIIERAIFSVLSLTYINNRRYIAIRHKYDPLDILKVTFAFQLVLSIIDVGLLVLPGAMFLGIHGNEPLILDILLSCRIMSVVMNVGGVSCSPTPTTTSVSILSTLLSPSLFTRSSSEKLFGSHVARKLWKMSSFASRTEATSAT